jgi:hypothetical protein
MLGPMEVLRRVLVLRRVAAADVAALEAQAQMHPGVAACQAFFTSVRRVRFAVELLWSDGTEMRASVHGVCSLLQLAL